MQSSEHSSLSHSPSLNKISVLVSNSGPGPPNSLSIIIRLGLALANPKLIDRKLGGPECAMPMLWYSYSIAIGIGHSHSDYVSSFCKSRK